MDIATLIASASDDSGIDVSGGPTTPDSSPLFGTSLSHSATETRFTSISDLISLEDTSAGQGREEKLPDILDPASAASTCIKNLCFIGAGYVGVPTAAVLALKNPALHVTVIDRDELRIRRWNSAHLPLHEPGLNEIVRITRDGCKAAYTEGMKIPDHVLPALTRRPNLTFSTSTATAIAAADVIFICVNTGTKSSGLGAGSATDLTAFEAVVREIAANAKSGAILVEKSTVPCRTAKLVQEILETLRPRAHFPVLSNPEFLSEGTAVNDLLQPSRIIIGAPHTSAGHRAAAALAKLYTSFILPSRILSTHVWSSELAKLVANAMLAQRISSINSISAICERTGAEVHEVAKAVGMDGRIGSKFLKAGLGFGGSCFRKDIGSLIYLARSLGLEEVADYWSQVLKINTMQRERFARMVIRGCNGTLIGKKISVFGFAFKKGTGDTRESLAVEVISTLLDERPTEIAVFDPVCLPGDIQRELDTLRSKHSNVDSVRIHTDPYQAAVSASAILIVTDWDFFRTEPPKPSTYVPSTAQPEYRDITPDQYLPQPKCPEECPDCKISFPGYGVGSEERIEWARISYHMKRPKLLFDGRDVVDGAKMEALGVKVVGLGRADESLGMGMGLGFGF